MFRSAVLRRLASPTVPLFVGAIERGFQIHCSALQKHSWSSVLSRETLECKAPLSFFSMANYSSNPSKISSDVHLFTITDDKIKCGKHNHVKEMPQVFPFEIQVKRSANTTGLMKNYHLENTDVLVSRPSLVAEKEYENNMRIGDDDEEGDNTRLSQSGTPLTVDVSKEEGDSLEFCYTAHKDDPASDGSSIRKKKKSGKKILPYEGPCFRSNGLLKSNEDECWLAEGVDRRSE